MKNIIINNEDIQLIEDEVNYVCISKQRSTSFIIPKSPFSIIGKDYGEIEDELKKFGIPTNVYTWENTNVIIVEILKKDIPMREVQKILNVEDYSYWLNSLRCIVIDVDQFLRWEEEE